MSIARRATLDIAKEDMHFSAAHFTVFSAAKRENLHGHDFYVAATVTSPIDADGLCFDYNLLKTRLRALCVELDETVLLPTRSPHLEVATEADACHVAFANERLHFLRRDVKLLPLRNITVEELAHWLLGELTTSAGFEDLPIERLELRVSSGPGQWAGATWEAEPSAGEREGAPLA